MLGLTLAALPCCTGTTTAVKTTCPPVCRLTLAPAKGVNVTVHKR